MRDEVTFEREMLDAVESTSLNRARVAWLAFSYDADARGLLIALAVCLLLAFGRQQRNAAAQLVNTAPSRPIGPRSVGLHGYNRQRSVVEHVGDRRGEL
jgi:hypothetical protein